MDIFSTYAVDEDKELNGTWRTIGDSKFKVARSNNENYVKLLAKKVEENREVLERGDEEARSLDRKIIIDIMAEAILLDWQNVTYKGAGMPYSKDNAKELLAHREFRREIARMSDEFSAYKAKLEEEAVKN